MAGTSLPRLPSYPGYPYHAPPNPPNYQHFGPYYANTPNPLTSIRPSHPEPVESPRKRQRIAYDKPWSMPESYIAPYPHECASRNDTAVAGMPSKAVLAEVQPSSHMPVLQRFPETGRLFPGPIQQDEKAGGQPVSYFAGTDDQDVGRPVSYFKGHHRNFSTSTPASTAPDRVPEARPRTPTSDPSLPTYHTQYPSYPENILSRHENPTTPVSQEYTSLQSSRDDETSPSSSTPRSSRHFPGPETNPYRNLRDPPSPEKQSSRSSIDSRVSGPLHIQLPPIIGPLGPDPPHFESNPFGSRLVGRVEPLRELPKISDTLFGQGMASFVQEGSGKRKRTSE